MKSLILAIFFLSLALPSRADGLKPVNSAVMLRGFCLAGSRDDDKAPGGYGKSDNSPKKISDKGLGKVGEIMLIASPNEIIPLDQSSKGFRLLLVNRTKSEAPFEASDSRLSIVQEALDVDGKWRPIEYLPASGCGNSYHHVFLPSGYYWEFVAPEYLGTQKTTLRFVLKGNQPIYSNEFKGSINPEQFNLPQGHKPTTLNVVPIDASYVNCLEENAEVELKLAINGHQSVKYFCKADKIIESGFGYGGGEGGGYSGDSATGIKDGKVIYPGKSSGGTWFLNTELTRTGAKVRYSSSSHSLSQGKKQEEKIEEEFDVPFMENVSIKREKVLLRAEWKQHSTND